VETVKDARGDGYNTDRVEGVYHSVR